MCIESCQINNTRSFTFIGTVFRSRTTRPIPMTVCTAATARSISLLTNDFLKRKKIHCLIVIKKEKRTVLLESFENAH